MGSCKKLRVIPININLASLEEVNMSYCSRLRSFPDISSNITKLSVKATKIKYVHLSMVRCWYRLECLEIGSRSLKTLTHVPLSVRKLDLSNSDIERIPDCVIGLPHLVDLIVEKCQKLVSIPALSPWLEFLNANECVSLKRVCCSFHNQMKIHSFYNCLQLDEEARRGIIQQSIYNYICLPGKEIPAEFNHKATGNSIIIPLATFSASSRFKACILVLPIKDYRYLGISCRLRSKGGVTINRIYSSARLSDMFPRSEHLFIFSGDLCHEVDVTISDIIFEFSCRDNDDKIIECGVQIMTEEADGSSSSQVDNFEAESSRSEVDNFETGSGSSELDYYESESSSGEVDYYESGGKNHYHTDGGGDEDYETQGFKLSQDENIKTSKHTGFRSWLRKLGLKRR